MTRTAKSLLGAFAAAMLMSVAAIAQMPGAYLDIGVAKVKPEKRAEFDGLMKKLADVNRRNKGDQWIAMETMYGEWNTISFVSTRQSYAEDEKAFDAFFGALSKAYGQAGAAKAWQDLNNTLISFRGEFRRRRFDLSANVPTDAAAYSKLIGESRWLRTTAVHVRPGHVLDVEGQLKDLKAALEKESPPHVTLVSQAVAGQHGTIFYVSSPVSSLGDFDGRPSGSQLLGEEGYRAFLKVTAESVASTETVINHFLPELSNPPEEIASASPDFWRPKPKPSAKPKEGEAKKAEPKKEQ